MIAKRNIGITPKQDDMLSWIHYSGIRVGQGSMLMAPEVGLTKFPERIYPVVIERKFVLAKCQDEETSNDFLDLLESDNLILHFHYGHFMRMIAFHAFKNPYLQQVFKDHIPLREIDEVRGLDLWAGDKQSELIAKGYDPFYLPEFPFVVAAHNARDFLQLQVPPSVEVVVNDDFEVVAEFTADIFILPAADVFRVNI